MIYIVLISLVIGLLIGYNSPIVIPLAYSKLFSVALVAALDAAFGGLRAAVAERFDKHVFVTGFFSNTLQRRSSLSVIASALTFTTSPYLHSASASSRTLPSCAAICLRTIGMASNND